MEESDAGTGGDSGPPRGKVARLLREYGITDLGDELVTQWTGNDGERKSIRELVAVVNRRLLEAALVDAGARPLDGEVANLHRLLSDDDIGAAERTRARRRLEREGVDVAAVEADFVSRQAVYTYLTDYREVSYDPSTSGDAADDVETIGRLRRRLQAVVDDRVEGLRTDGTLVIAEPEVLVDVRVYCEGCGTEFATSDLAAGEACDCP